MDKLHHIHMALADGVKKSRAVAADVDSFRIRLEGGNESRDRRADVIERIVWLWNAHDGIPTEAFKAGKVRTHSDAELALLDVIERMRQSPAHGLPGEVIEAAEKLRAARITNDIDWTEDGRRTACPAPACSEGDERRPADV